MKPPWLTLHLLNTFKKGPRSDGKGINGTFTRCFTMMNSKMMKETQVTDWLQVLVPTKRDAGSLELPPPLPLQEGPQSHHLFQGEPCRQPHSPAICVTLASCYSAPQLLGPWTSLSSISLPIKSRTYLKVGVRINEIKYVRSCWKNVAYIKCLSTVLLFPPLPLKRLQRVLPSQHIWTKPLFELSVLNHSHQSLTESLIYVLNQFMVSLGYLSFSGMRLHAKDIVMSNSTMICNLMEL